MGGGKAARICEIFLYKESGNCFFFVKNPNLTKKKKKKKKTILAVGRGGGGCVARVSIFFFSKESITEKKSFLYEGMRR